MSWPCQLQARGRAALALQQASLFTGLQSLSESSFTSSPQKVFTSRKHQVGSITFREKRQQMRIASKLALPGPSEGPSHGRGSVRTKFATDLVASTSAWDDELSARSYNNAPAMRRPHIAEAAVGMVVCSARGCRPIFASAESVFAEREVTEGGGVCVEQRIGAEAKKKPVYPDGFVEYLKEVWMEKDVAQRLYEKELRQDPRSAKILASYAAFAYKEQNDVTLADRLYRQALQEAPEDADLLSSYALFLWQTEA
ncbi:hypothetical protein KFL_000370220 [Klebsormidium nitens]|uniref:Uncharacterized protein n=1 Tax=Klebsormidium nitens TaxID=105231 RepID=A0A1Y1HV84_KLENI|nr:hypothetical protein KFL_000370220 [Klebsormidium nitens]|eukprot:GAQ79748.1 hypothetical protein KFL_000370220 [Klebsormidium nitens]